MRTCEARPQGLVLRAAALLLVACSGAGGGGDPVPAAANPGDGFGTGTTGAVDVPSDMGSDLPPQDGGREDASNANPDGGHLPSTVDPGTGPWQPVPREQVAEVCGLDPDLLDAADQQLNLRWGIVRHGRLCHEFYPSGSDAATVGHVFSSTKTFGAVVAGRLMYETRNARNTGPRTGPIQEFDRVDEWIDVDATNFDIHPDATIAHVMAMVAYSDDLSFGSKAHSYDADGTREINAMSDILNAAIDQDPARLGHDLEEFTQRHVYAPLGMNASVWSDGAPDKNFAFSWHTTVRDMLRVGLFINNGGVWDGERLVSAQYLYNMIHPAFEDGNTGYGYLTWLNGADHRPPGVGQFLKNPAPPDDCAPLALHRAYPHGISKSPDCGYMTQDYTCEQQFDAGTWSAQGLNGNYIYGHRGLDLVLAIQDYGTLNTHTQLWDAMRPALVALDPKYRGNERAFCNAYSRGNYAPDLKRWEGGL